MDIRTDLHRVTVEIATARRIVADLEALRLLARRRVDETAATLATARIMLMSRADAGTNDAARRAYAERETTAERDHLADAQAHLTSVEIDLIHANATLRISEDHRRYLETLVTLDADRATEIAIHADNGDGDGLGVLPTFDNGDESNLPF